MLLTSVIQIYTTTTTTNNNNNNSDDKEDARYKRENYYNNITINSYKKILHCHKYPKKKNSTSESSSGENAHLKKVSMENICVAVVYISDTTSTCSYTLRKNRIMHRYSAYTWTEKIQKTKSHYNASGG